MKPGFWTLLCLLMAAPAAAFLVQSTQAGSGPVVQVSWRVDEVSYVLDAAGSADLGAAETARILRQSFAVWNDVAGSRLTLRDAGISTGRSASRRDRRNLVLFDETGDILAAPAGSGIIAVTRINSDAVSGEIFDADIVFNGRDFRFAAQPTSNRILLSDVAVHEIGHFIGLDHTPLAGAPEQRPTMNPFYFSDGPGQSTSLATDDLTGVRVLYPTAEFTASTSTITGHVTSLEGTGIFGAHVTAVNLNSGELYSTLSGADTGILDRGAYTLHGLPAGSYQIAIEPLGHGIDESNFSDLFVGIDTDFPAEFFGNTTAAEEARPVIVVPGTSSADIDFTTGFVVPGEPYIRSVDGPGNTPDTNGPYDTFVDMLFTRRVDVEVDVDGVMSTSTAADLGDGMFRARIAGQPVGSHIRYRLQAESAAGVRVNFPADGAWFEFDVIGLSGSPLAFAVLRDAGVLGVFDTGASGEVARVDVGEDPIQILHSADGGFLYVSNLGSSEITIIDAATFRIADRIAVAAQPLDMALSPDGATLYVSNSGASVLTAIDVETRKVLGFVSVGALAEGPYGIATSGDRVYVTDLNADEVLVVAGGTVVSRIPVNGGPRSLATSADGTSLYVTSFNSGDLTIIDTARDVVEAVISMPVSGSFAIAIGPDGDRAYVTAHDDGVVIVVDLTSRQVSATIQVGADPRGLSFSPAGDRLYVTTSASNEIYIFAVDSHILLGTFAALGGPRGISIIDAPTQGPITTVTDVVSTPESWALSDLYPNPFNPEARLTLTLPVAGDVHVEVYNVLGQRVRHFELAGRPAGHHVLSWDGRNDLGHPVGSGVYVFAVRVGNATSPMLATRKGVLLR
ncbi:MAG: beta-propeller fold lactonase family protein [bacterium]|nr:beta-propeller fold lactonase family protein [bacterium]